MQLGKTAGSDLVMHLQLHIDHMCYIRAGFKLSQKVHLIIGSEPDHTCLHSLLIMLQSPSRDSINFDCPRQIKCKYGVQQEFSK